MGEKMAIISMKVDLKCDKCYKKIRKVLCKFPEIRDRVYDEKLNVVMITVVSCCPEFIMKKIASKGGKSIEKMEMMTGEKKKAEEKPKEGGGEKKKEEKPKEGGGEKKKAEEKPKVGGGGEKPNEKPKEGGGDDKKKKEGDGEKKKEGGGGGDGGGDKAKDKGPPPVKKDGEAHKLVREPSVPVSGYPSIFPPVYPVQASYPPAPYYPQPVYGYGPGHNHGAYGAPPYGPGHYHGMEGYDHRGTHNADQYGPYYDESDSTCTIM